MRKRIFIGFMLVSGAVALHGQIIGGMGIKGGISLANQSHQFTPLDFTIETKPIEAPAVTLFVEFFSGRNLGYQLDLSYVTKGSKSTTQSITVNHLDENRIVVNQGDLTISKFSYLVVSPLVRYRFDLSPLTPYLMLGPRMDYLLNYETESAFPLEDQNQFILGLNIGAGAEFNLGKLGVFLEVQYQPDLSPVTNREPLLINNDVILFYLGIRYKSASL